MPFVLAEVAVRWEQEQKSYSLMDGEQVELEEQATVLSV